MKKPFIVGFATLIVSTAASAYILSKSISFESYGIFTFILSFALFLIVALHISTTIVLKPNNALWTVARTLIIPEVITTCILLIWKPIAAFAEIGIASLVILYNCRLIHNKPMPKNTKSKIKRLIRCINVNILLCSVILIPGVFIMVPHLTNSKAMITIPSRNVSQTTEYNIAPSKWELITISQKTDFIEGFLETQAVQLNMDTIPNIEVAYIPQSIFGSYTQEEDLIILNAAIVQDSNAEQIVQTLSHELFHRCQHALVENFSNGTLPYDSLTDDQIERIKNYAYDFQNYKPGGINEESFNQYYNQPCEIDARAYAEQVVTRYFHTT